MPDPNYPTGTAGIVAIDKMGNEVLFLHPDSFETLQALSGFAPRCTSSRSRPIMPGPTCRSTATAGMGTIPTPGARSR